MIKEDIQNVEAKACDIRDSIIEMLTEAKSGHTAGPLGMADIFASLYFHILNHNPKDPEWEDRDRLILSNGHIVPVRYATMAHAGYFPVKEVLTLRKFGSRLQGHPEPERLPGLETTSGPLGSGLSQAAGMAYSFKMDGKSPYVYCLLSDGELQAGNTWEAAMFAGNNNLNNLIGIIDRNEILEYLMELFSESLVIKKIITKFSPDIIYASKEVIETIKGQGNKLKLIEIYEEHENELSFDSVNIRKKIGGFEINSKISRKRFK